MNEPLKVLDQMEEIRQKAAEHPEQYPIDYTIRLLTAIVANSYGYQNRNDRTEQLKESPESRYHHRYFGEAGQFHV